ncbi:N-acetylmuramoyl-L-alanine amidase family protein [Pseudalkalibacillus caeni]|uniref:N-acetylmuramoyl-L-alanine amidase n=1 Tax=Exobacillus caeni TaxID=2574798 RepID=A0A5R9F1H0_9BACL|nr:N-acetylmuramoyl-L-alanine amidase [Pseudalkalibacillus caeni]TLS36276.1 N-acetylmuramoyl-L-alanine amidase [Pseudalkalibacillus caeni]
MTKIFIDPGHGGTDTGATGNGLLEKNLTLEIGLQVRDILQSSYQDVEVMMSRSSDITVSLEQRTTMANNWGANLFVAVHINAGGGTGYEDYVYPGVGLPTISYQEIIHSEILKQVDFYDRGKKEANFYVLRETGMPAILTENGFIDTLEDANKLKDPSFLHSIAQGHANGIARAMSLQLNPYTYRVIADGKQEGAYSNYDNVLSEVEEHLGEALKIEVEKV